MPISRYNNEHYPDPTAYLALSNVAMQERKVRKFRPIVYICSPYAGDIPHNIEAAKAYSRFAVAMGYIPLAPHLLFPQFLNDSNYQDRQLGLYFGIVLMSKCSEIWVFGNTISPGMAAEIQRAKCKKYRIRYFTESCKEVL